MKSYDYVFVIQGRLLFMKSRTFLLMQSKEELNRFPIYFISRDTTINYSTPQSTQTVLIAPSILLSIRVSIPTCYCQLSAAT